MEGTMDRLTSREPRASGMPGVCCTHFCNRDCQAIQGHCAAGCLWEEAVWERLAAYEDTGLTPEEITTLIHPPNPPLTTEELLELDGEPVWNDNEKEWIVVDLAWYTGKLGIGHEGDYMDLTNRYYRRRPEEGN